MSFAAVGAEVRFVGTARGFETRLVPAASYDLDLIHVGQLKGVSLATGFRTLLDLPLGVWRCFEILNTFGPMSWSGWAATRQDREWSRPC